MNNDLISVIVPCYNVEKYIKKCVESIVNQTYQNLEIILVDDGATDGTPALCDELAKTDDRIKVLHKVNEGVSIARNFGIDNSNGNFITFFDSDDWIEPDTIKTAYDRITADNSDLVVWGYSADFVDDNECVLNSRKCAVSGVCETGSDNNDVLIQKDTLGLCGYVWNKLYKTKIIKSNNLIFDSKLSLYEDLLFNSIYFANCKNIELMDYIGNHYIQRGHVTLGTKRYENIFELKLLGCEAREDILKHFGIPSSNINKIMASFYYGALKSIISNIKTEPNASKKEKLQKLKLLLSDKKVQEVAKKSNKVSLKQKVLVVAVRWHLASVLLKI